MKNKRKEAMLNNQIRVSVNGDLVAIMDTERGWVLVLDTDEVDKLNRFVIRNTK